MNTAYQQIKTNTSTIDNIFRNWGCELPKNRRKKENNIDALIDTLNNKYKVIGWKVDLQEDFVSSGERSGYKGALAIKDAEEIISAVEKVEKILKSYAFPILGSMDYHKADSAEFSKEGEKADFKNTFPPHCIAGTYGAEFADWAEPKNPLYVDWTDKQDMKDLTSRILAHEGDVIFRKDAFDVFSEQGNKYAKPIVENLSVKNAIVYGVALEVCNDFAIKGLLDLGVKVYAVTDAMKAINEDNRKNVLDAWKEQKVNLVTSDQLCCVLSSIKRYE
jgi:nicotinamidase/pyrazinamidase